MVSFYLHLMMYMAACVILCDNLLAQNEACCSSQCCTETLCKLDCSSCKWRWPIFDLELSLQHTEGRGIGYHRGFTTLDIFLMPSLGNYSSLYPFIDIRGIGFNNRKLGLNAGLGLRYLSSCDRVWGIHVYYDNRQGSHIDFQRVGYVFQQMGVGLEWLGNQWDFRANFYLPLGKQERHFSQTHVDDYTGLISSIVRKREWMLTAADAEIGICLGRGVFERCCLDWNAYLAMGPYYLADKHDKSRFGGKGRLSFTLARYYLVEVRGGYDPLTNGTFQLRLGINIPLYPLSAVSHSISCAEKESACCLRRLLAQPVQRAEVIPLREKSIEARTINNGQRS